MDSSLLVTYIQRLENEGTMTYRAAEGLHWKMSESTGVLGSRLWSKKWVQWPLIPVRRCESLVWITCELLGNWSLLLRDKQLQCLISMIRKDVAYSTLTPAQWWDELLLGHTRSSLSSPDVKSYIIWSLNISPYSNTRLVLDSSFICSPFNINHLIYSANFTIRIALKTLSSSPHFSPPLYLNSSLITH